MNVLLMIGLLLAPPKADEEMVEYLLNGNKAHMERFAFLEVRFRLTLEAKAKTLEDALAGRWLDEPEPRVQRVYFAKRGELTRREEGYDKELAKRFEERSGRRLAEHAYLSDSKIEFVYQDLPHHSGNNIAVHKAQPGDRLSPFVMFYSVPLHQLVKFRLSDSKDKATKQVYIGEREYDGRILHVVEVSFWSEMSNQKHKCVEKFWIDAQRGFLPLRIDTYRSGELERTSVVKQVADLGVGRWMPILWRTVTPDNNIADPVAHSVTELAVDEVNVAEPLADDVFTLNVPPGTLGRSMGNSGWFLCKTGKVMLDDFNDAGQPRSEQSEVVDAEPPRRYTPPQPSSPPSPLATSRNQVLQYWPEMLCFFLVVAGVALVWIRTMRRSKR